jgi:hypothetical protein
MGSFELIRRTSDSGFAVNFHFCPNCGSTVFWEPERRPETIAVAVGSFADPTFPPPSQSVYGGTPRWIAFIWLTASSEPQVSS